MNETLFYVIGLSLVVLAVVVSFVGLRWEKFPTSRGMMGAVAGVFALLVIATAVFGWRNAEDEQEHRETELAEAVEENEASGNEGEAQEASEQGEDTEEISTAAADGAQVYEAQGCGSCHTLDAAGSSGTTGPNLDGALAGESTEFIETSIIDPADEVAEGYPPNVMPPDYETQLTPEELDALVKFLEDSTNETAGAADSGGS
jgi:mono/diheme cytochrome c family protein